MFLRMSQRPLLAFIGRSKALRTFRHVTTTRRSFLTRSAGAAAGLSLASPLDFFGGPPAGATEPARRDVAGPLLPARDQTTGLELIKLPQGFEYLSFGWTGDGMADGRPTPHGHDGMAAFRGEDGLVRLVRNHELGGYGGAFATGMTYDPAAQGGTTTLTFDPDAGAEVGAATPSLAGTIRNCGGGPTPWGSWLSCEETLEVNGAVRHGYVFEVPAAGSSDGVPIRGMGRFNHEAVAIDPSTGIAYLTEDATPSGLYRYVPTAPGDLAAGGRLQMLALGAVTTQTYQDTGPRDYGVVSWVDIAEPDPAPGAPSVVTQGIAAGGAQFERLEGIWHHDGTIWFVATSGGPNRGQLFALEPGTDRLRLVFHSPGSAVLDSPDNICLSPRGGMILCEDGSGREYLHGFTADGSIFPFAENAVVLTGHRGFHGDFSGSEWCGATFEPRQGNWLFVSLQSPGITLAITGPWKRLGL
jgi:secreted PhoX family phosphatase